MGPHGYRLTCLGGSLSVPAPHSLRKEPLRALQGAVAQSEFRGFTTYSAHSQYLSFGEGTVCDRFVFTPVFLNTIRDPSPEHIVSERTDVDCRSGQYVLYPDSV